ncbi:ABC transporter substrate-binding protein [Thermodesulfobacteriota bacterium]
MKTVIRILFGIALISLIVTPGVLAKEIKVGVEMPLTGKLARVGNAELEGIKVAAEMFGTAHPDLKIKLVVLDNESQPAKAIAAVEKLASEDVIAITGGYGSNIIGPASEAANKAGVLYITSGGVAANLSQRGHKTFFRINNTAGYSKAMAGIIMDMAAKSVSIIYSTKQATSDLAKDVQKVLAAKGVKVKMHSYDPAITDFKPVVNKIKLMDKPDVVGMVGYENDYVGIIRAAKVLKPKVKAMVGVWSLATPKMWNEFPDLMPNVYGTALLPFPTDFKTPEGKEFSDTYKKLHNKEPDYLGQFGYVQTRLLLEAIARAEKKGKLNRTDLAEELRKTDRDTLVGRVQFDEKGDNNNFTHRMGQHQNGKIVIVWPKDGATGKMNFPAVPW